MYRDCRCVMMRSAVKLQILIIGHQMNWPSGPRPSKASSGFDWKVQQYLMRFFGKRNNHEEGILTASLRLSRYQQRRSPKTMCKACSDIIYALCKKPVLQVSHLPSGGSAADCLELILVGACWRDDAAAPPATACPALAKPNLAEA